MGQHTHVFSGEFLRSACHTALPSSLTRAKADPPTDPKEQPTSCGPQPPGGVPVSFQVDPEGSSPATSGPHDPTVLNGTRPRSSAAAASDGGRWRPRGREGTSAAPTPCGCHTKGCPERSPAGGRGGATAQSCDEPPTVPGPALGRGRPRGRRRREGKAAQPRAPLPAGLSAGPGPEPGSG